MKVIQEWKVHNIYVPVEANKSACKYTAQNVCGFKALRYLHIQIRLPAQYDDPFCKVFATNVTKEEMDYKNYCSKLYECIWDTFGQPIAYKPKLFFVHFDTYTTRICRVPSFFIVLELPIALHFDAQTYSTHKMHSPFSFM